MIGHLFTLLFVGAEAAPEDTSGGGGGDPGGNAALAERERLLRWHLGESERIKRINTMAVQIIVALVASGELD
jgi:hypothetical protein